jgi:hypothetical protein
MIEALAALYIVLATGAVIVTLPLLVGVLGLLLWHNLTRKDWQ